MAGVADTRLYDLLGVPPDADLTAIKKAYKKLALKHHPDRGGDTDAFQRINSANEILSDPEKRRIYDQYGEEGLRQSMEGQGGQNTADFSGFFQNLFGGGGSGDLFGDLFGQFGARQRGPRRPEPVQLRVTVGLEEVFHGATKRFAINRTVPCGGCSGSGTSESNAVRPCAACQGQGVQVRVRRVMGGVQQVQQVCPSCRGEGRVVPRELLCKSCGGRCTMSEKHVVEVSVPAGVVEGHTEVLRGAGDRLPGAAAGDVVLVFAVREHERFVRQGQHLLCPVELSLTEALTGASVDLKHVSGQQLRLCSPPDAVLQPGSWRRVRGEGLPGPGGRGDLFLRVEVRFPESRDDPAVQELLQKLAPVLPEDASVRSDDFWSLLRRFLHRLRSIGSKAEDPQPTLVDSSPQPEENVHERIMEPAPELADMGQPFQNSRRSRL